jgi:transcriptional regulator with XRE-family HTH domain
MDATLDHDLQFVDLAPLQEQSDSLRAVLAQVGPRLRQLRQDRGGTLGDLAAATGISVSTLSRLESGQRRPSLEVLLPIARAYQVPLDELVAEIEAEDPRVQLAPTRRGGLTIQPLSKYPGGTQVFRMTVPPSLATPQPQGHEGRDWVHVLHGRLHLVLAGRDLVLEAGEAAEFDGRLPHWFGSTGEAPVEFLTMLDAAGERQHLRGRARREQADA